MEILKRNEKTQKAENKYFLQELVHQIVKLLRNKFYL